MASPDADPRREEELQRERRLRGAWGFVQAGFGVFLGFVLFGLLPAALGRPFPALLGKTATVVVLILAPAIPVGLLVVAALRLRR